MRFYFPNKLIDLQGKPVQEGLDSFWARSAEVSRTAWSSRALPLFVIGGGPDELLRSRCRDGRQEKRTVVTVHAGMTSHNLEEKNPAHFIEPRFWPGRVYFSFAAIGAALQSDPTHHKTPKAIVQPGNVARFLWERKGCAIRVCNPVAWAG